MSQLNLESLKATGRIRNPKTRKALSTKIRLTKAQENAGWHTVESENAQGDKVATAHYAQGTFQGRDVVIALFYVDSPYKVSSTGKSFLYGNAGRERFTANGRDFQLTANLAGFAQDDGERDFLKTQQPSK